MYLIAMFIKNHSYSYLQADHKKHANLFQTIIFRESFSSSRLIIRRNDIKHLWGYELLVNKKTNK